MTIRAHRLVAAGALAVAAVAAPIAISLISVEAPTQVATPKCLSWVGNKDDNICTGYSNGNGINVSSPGTQIATGNAGNNRGGGIGISTGPLAPGQTFNSSVG